MFLKALLFSVSVLFATALTAQSSSLDTVSIDRFVLNTKVDRYKDSLIAFFRDSASDLHTHYKEFVFTGITEKNPLKIGQISFALPVLRTDANGVIKGILLSNSYTANANNAESPKKTARNTMLFLYNFIKDNWKGEQKPERRIVKHKLDMIEYRWTSKESHLILRRTIDRKMNTVSVLLQSR